MSKPKGTFEVRNQAGQGAEIFINGYIGTWDEVDYARLRAQMRELVKTGSVTLCYHCYGGNMYEGMPMCDEIAANASKTTHLIEGMAASMAAVMTQAGGKRVMRKHARLMFHKPQGGVSGESEEMRKYADELDSLEKQVLKLLMKRTGKDEAACQNLLKANTPTWITADEAKELGLVDEVIDGEALVPENAWREKSPEDVWNITNQLSEQNFNNTNMKKPIISVLNAYKVEHNLTENNTDQQFAETVENALKGRDNRIKELEGKLEQQTLSTIKNAIDQGIKEGRCTEAEREEFEEIGKTSGIAILNKIINKLPARVDVNNSLVRGKKEEREDSTDPRSKWTLRDWEEKAPKDLQKKMREDKEWYDAMFKKQYGEEEETD